MARTLKEHNYFGIDATVIADSKNPQGDRITSVVVTLPRIVLAELNTHRMFSRNSASSRAVPFKKMLKRVEKHPFIPLAFQKDHKGMQGTEYITEEESVENCRAYWLETRDWALSGAEGLNDDKLEGVTKQLCNRLLEPFMWHTVLVTATEFDNFFDLRCPQYYYEPENIYFKSKKDFGSKYSACFGSDEFVNWTEEKWQSINTSQAEIHIQAAAEAMWDSINESTPKELKEGEWHIPFISKELLEWDDICDFLSKKESTLTIPDIVVEETIIKIATARCARVSYLNFEGKDDYESDIKLHDRLKEARHASPFEHCARVMNNEEYNSYLRGKMYPITSDSFQKQFSAKTGYTPVSGAFKEKELGWCRNFKGFIQYRHLIEKE